MQANQENSKANIGDFQIRPVVVTSASDDKDNDLDKGTVSDFRARSKAFEPVAFQLVNLVSNCGAKGITIYAKNIYSEAEIAKLGKSVKLDKETIDGIAEPLARIIARRCTNEEILDWICVFGGLLALGSGIAVAAIEISKQRKIQGVMQERVNEPAHN